MPPQLVQCLAAFLDFCYIVHCSELGISDLEEAQNVLNQFHIHCEVFHAEVCPTAFSDTLPLNGTRIRHTKWTVQLNY